VALLLTGTVKLNSLGEAALYVNMAQVKTQKHESPTRRMCVPQWPDQMRKVEYTKQMKNVYYDIERKIDQLI
jgi:hypothetical protein